MNIKFPYRSGLETLPSISEQLNQLWRVAILLDQIGMPLEDWCPPADTPDNARRNIAFDKNGPSPAAIAIFQEEEKSDRSEQFRRLGVWNGKEDTGGAVLLHKVAIASNHSRSSFELNSKAVQALEKKGNIVQIINTLLEIFPAPFIQVSPPPYATRHAVFEDHPGVGWMLYLPEILTPAQVPEAPELIAVRDKDKKQKGTIVVSVSDETFSVKNKEHIKAANAIEIRLADQDLLPRFSNL
ncbi:immunity 52 family protein [Herbaspirillum sp. DW155]|uniref:immunity 52 family protein n=1 Tax=Herbaspirillum sp. DW155 TaxID=3095609 RepID=UPI003089A717|nr:immunity 52 family protein [Herbaspirillum sp. DW155]